MDIYVVDGRGANGRVSVFESLEEALAHAQRAARQRYKRVRIVITRSVDGLIEVREGDPR